MADPHKIEKIKKVSKAGAAEQQPVAEVQEQPKRVAPNKEEFDKLLLNQQNEKQKPQKAELADASRKSSPMDEIRDLNSGSAKPTRVTPAEVVAQTQEAINKLEEIKGKLNTPKLNIPDSVSTLMRNKIVHMDENIRIALSRTGSEYQTPSAPIAVTPTDSPVVRFLGLLTHGQYQLQNLAGELAKFSGKEISPANLLAIQIKVGYIQQEIEFFSGLLNKALESTKTIMNVQV